MSANIPSRYELIFEKIGFTIDLVAEKYLKTNFAEIDNLVEKIIITDDPEHGLENIQEVFQEFKVPSTQINDKIIYYLAAKVNLIYPNGLADIYNANPKNSFSIDEINYNILLKTPEKFKEYFISISSLNQNILNINAEINNSESVYNSINLQKTNTSKLNYPYNSNASSSSNFVSSNGIFINNNLENFSSSIENLLNPARKVNLKQIVQKRILMQDIEVVEEPIYQKIREMLFPSGAKWEKNFEDNMKKFFEYIDEDSKIFYNYVISFHTLDMREELVKYYTENLKNNYMNVVSEFEAKKFLEFYCLLEFKFRLLIISRIYNFITGVSIVFDFINSNQVNLRFYSDELKYVKIAESFSYPLQLKPYALKYALLEEKCKIKDEEFNSFLQESINQDNNNTNTGFIPGVENIYKENSYGEAENENLINNNHNNNKNLNSENAETEKAKIFNGIFKEMQSLSTLNMDAKLNIMNDKITEMNNDYRKLKTEDFDNSNHLNFPPFQVCCGSKYEKFRNYNEKDDFTENDLNDDFMNLLPHKKKEKKKLGFFSNVDLAKGHKQNFFVSNLIQNQDANINNNSNKNNNINNKTNEEKGEEAKALTELVNNYFCNLDLPHVNKGLSIFRSIDKLRLLSLSFDRIFRVEKLKNYEFLNLSFFKRSLKTQIYSEKRWTFLKDSINVLSEKTKTKFISHFRNFLGEEISFYLLWLQELIISLLIPSFLGSIAYIFLIVKTTNEKGELVLLSGKYVFDFFQIQIRIRDLIKFALCFMTAIWCFVFLQHWKSMEKFYSYVWGCGNSEEMEPQQESYTCKQEINFIFDWKIKIQDKTMYAIKKLISLSISILLVCLVIFINFSLLVVKKEKLALNKDSLFWNYFPTVVSAVLIKLMSFIYRTLASKLSYWENHEKNSKRVAQLSFKIFLFEFVNNFFTYYYIGFYKSFKNVCIENNCTQEIQIQSYVSLAIIASINFLEIGIPYLIYMLKLRNLQKKNLEKANATSLLTINNINNNVNDNNNNNNNNLTQNLIHTDIVDLVNSDEMKIELSSMDSLIEDYIEIIIYLAYVLLITSAAPLTPLFILILLLSERSIDAFKIYYFIRVEFLNSSSGISIYNYMIRIILYVGTITNLGLVLFSRKFESVDAVTYKDSKMSLENFLLKFLILLILENLLFLIGSFIRFKDYPDWMENTGLIEKSYTFMYWNVNKQNLPHLNNIRLTSEKNFLEKNEFHKKKELIKKLELFHNDPKQLISKTNDENNKKNLTEDRIVLDNVDYEMHKGL